MQYNYLSHYGIKGQKHGIRRYQNEDGSLTTEGRDHYGVGDPRRAGGLGLRDKQGNRVSVAANIKAGYKNAPRVAKAAFKQLFKKDSKTSVARGVDKKKTDSNESDANTKNEKPKMSKQQKIRKVSKIISTSLKIGAAAALIGVGLKNKDKIKEAASLIKDTYGEIRWSQKISYHNAKADNYEKRGRTSTSIGEQARYAARASEHRVKARKLFWHGDE